MRLPETSESFPEVPVVPLIDVIFTLLTFFIVATLFIEKSRAIDLRLPKAETTNQVKQKKDEQAAVSVDRNGKFYFDKKPITEAALKAKIKALPEKTLIVLSGDERTNYEDISRVMEVISGAGKSRVGLAAEPIDTDQ